MASQCTTGLPAVTAHCPPLCSSRASIWTSFQPQSEACKASISSLPVWDLRCWPGALMPAQRMQSLVTQHVLSSCTNTSINTLYATKIFSEIPWSCKAKAWPAVFPKGVLLLQPNHTVLTAPCVTGTTASVIKRWNVSVQMSWRVASKLWDRLAHTHGSAAKVPVLNVDISAAALLVHLDASSLKSLLGLAASILHFFQYREYRRLRPQVRDYTVVKHRCKSSALSWCLRMRLANMLHLLPVGTGIAGAMQRSAVNTKAGETRLVLHVPSSS